MRTHFALPFLMTAVFAVSAISLPVQAQHEHAEAHAHEDHASSGLSLNNGVQWETDAALRHGMTEIRAAVESVATTFDEGQLALAQAQQLSETVQGSVNTMIAQCELEPEADANLHSILAMLLSGAAALESSPMSSEGVPALKEALQAYGQYFNHTGWQGEDHSAHSSSAH